MLLFPALLITITCVTFTVGDKEDAQSTLPKPNPIPVTFTMSYSFGFAIFSSLIAAASGAIMVFELLNTKHMIPMWKEKPQTQTLNKSTIIPFVLSSRRWFTCVRPRTQSRCNIQMALMCTGKWWHVRMLHRSFLNDNPISWDCMYLTFRTFHELATLTYLPYLCFMFERIVFWVFDGIFWQRNERLVGR